MGKTLWPIFFCICTFSTKVSIICSARSNVFVLMEFIYDYYSLITLYDIDRQEKVMEITPKVSRVIPYAETLAWVSADTFVAVSHLKLGQSWEGVKENLERAKAEGKDVSESDPTRFSPPETQTNLISIYYNREGELKNRIFTIQGFPHDRPIQTVTAVASENNNMGYVTAGHDKRLVSFPYIMAIGPIDVYHQFIAVARPNDFNVVFYYL